MRRTIVFIQLLLLVLLFSSFQSKEQATFSLTIKVSNLRNSHGAVQYALYNDSESFPDEHYKKNYRELT